MKKLNWEWIAGFYEGEGSAGCYHNKRENRYHLKCTISQQNKNILNRIKSFVGFGSVCIAVRETGVYKWQASTNQARIFLNNVLPYLKTTHKKKQLLKALKRDRRFVNV